MKKNIFKLSLIFFATLIAVITISAIYFVYIDTNIKNKYSNLHKISLQKATSELSPFLQQTFDDLERINNQDSLEGDYYAYGKALQTQDGYQMSLTTVTMQIQQDIPKAFYDRIGFSSKSITPTQDKQYLVFSKEAQTGFDLLLIEYNIFVSQFNFYDLDNIMLIDENGLIVFSLLDMDETNVYKLFSYDKYGAVFDENSSFADFHNTENYIISKETEIDSFYVMGYADVEDMHLLIKEERMRYLFFIAGLAAASFLGAFLIAVIYSANNNRNLVGKFTRGKYSVFVDKFGKILYKNKKFKKDFKLDEIVSYTFDKNEKLRKSLLSNGDITLKLIDRKGEKRYLRFMTARAFSGFRMVGSDVTDIMKDYIKSKRQTNCNNLSELPNTVQLREDYEKVRIREPENLSCVAFLEICGTEKYRVMFGDKFYRKLIKAFSERINGIFKGMVYHSGDNKFIVFTHTKELTVLLTENRSRYLSVLEAPFEIEKNSIKLCYKIGLSRTFLPVERMDLSQPIKQAKQVYFTIRKTPNRSTGMFYDALMKNELYLYEEKEAIIDLIKNDKLQLYFQPQFSIKHNKITGFEALLRLKKKINISIGEFIELCERNGSIIEVGNFVYQKAMEFAKEMQDKGITISLNISPVQLMQEGFTENFLNYFRKIRLNPNSIAVEITESFLISSYETVISKLELLKKEGVYVHLDDFGVEYSSMLYLKKLPIKVIKIDKQFIDDIESNYTSRIITETVIDLATKMDLYCIAEGVETKEQIDTLKELKCDIIQGYYISKAVPREEAIEMLNKYNKEK